MKDLLKKLQAVLNTPAGVMTALVAITLAGEFLTLFLIESIDTAILKDVVLKNRLFEFIAPIALAATVSIALYLLIFKPMSARQVELERQLDELRNPLAAENAGTIQPATGSPEKQRLATEQFAAQPIEESQRSAPLSMLEELKAERNKIEKAYREWLIALDGLNDPIFLHDQQFRILRCNKAYQQCAGIPFQEIIGQPYYEVFPKSGTPLASCQQSMEKAENTEKEEVAVGNAIYRSCALAIHDEQGKYLYSVHTLEDITERKLVESELRETRDYLENLVNYANAPIIVWSPSNQITLFNYAFERLTGRDANEVIGKQIDILFPPDRLDEALTHIYQAQAGERWESIEIPILHSSGEVRTALWSSATIYSSDGKNVIATIAQGQDITGRKKMEANLAEQVVELRRWYDTTLGRESRILDLKHEVNELLGQAGQPPRYPSAESEDQQEK